MSLSERPEPIDYQQLLALLARGSSLDLYRLSNGIQRLLDDPKRAIAVKRQLREGQMIEYFDTSENRFIHARVLELKRTRITVENSHDGRRWLIPYYAIRLPQADILTTPSPEKLDRHTLQVGSRVGFLDKHGHEHYGTVRKLNPKTASLDCSDGRWRVAYSLLFPVIDSEKNTPLL